MNAVSIPGSEELEVLSPSCIEIVQGFDNRLQCPRSITVFRTSSVRGPIHQRFTVNGSWNILNSPWVKCPAFDLLWEIENRDISSGSSSSSDHGSKLREPSQSSYLIT
ncbi:hypothetical protein AVEN_219231-1 [Araneus ventricosus]|uniref:Uncharacterized protein n=1 Tax=Araneus ventricosus TaxID=182803 RepID=A0A4Y2HPU2_ARAVE|nr:hypothetical protein AVEN_219231-1 [Araneus ventricosus]